MAKHIGTKCGSKVPERLTVFFFFCFSGVGVGDCAVREPHVGIPRLCGASETASGLPFGEAVTHLRKPANVCCLER